MKMLDFKSSRKKPEGITSLIVVIAISLILTVIVGGIAALTSREIRQASNTDQSNRASKIAESAARIVDTNLAGSEVSYDGKACLEENEVNKFDFKFDGGEVTCLKIQNKFEKLEKNQKSNTSIEIYSEGAQQGTVAYSDKTNDKLIINYQKRDSVVAPGYTGSLYPTNVNYKNAAALEISVVYWPKKRIGDNYVAQIQTGVSDNLNLRGSNVKTAKIFVMPNRTDEGFTANKGSGQVKSSCDLNTTGEYYCKLTNGAGGDGINLGEALGEANFGSSYFYSARITPYYADTQISVETKELIVTQNSTQQLDETFTTSQIFISATAKVGDLFRRIRYSSSTSTSSSSALGGVVNSAIFAGKDGNDKPSNICKNILLKSAGVNTFTKVENVENNKRCN